jgi:hypothetical protein
MSLESPQNQPVRLPAVNAKIASDLAIEKRFDGNIRPIINPALGCLWTQKRYFLSQRY